MLEKQESQAFGSYFRHPIVEETGETPARLNIICLIAKKEFAVVILIGGLKNKR
jgi:hypothetical protein